MSFALPLAALPTPPPPPPTTLSDPVTGLRPPAAGLMMPTLSPPPDGCAVAVALGLFGSVLWVVGGAPSDGGAVPSAGGVEGWQPMSAVARAKRVIHFISA